MKACNRQSRRPTSPGEVLLYEFLYPSGMTRGDLARRIGCDVAVVDSLVSGESRVGEEMALALASVFGTTPQFWVNLQSAADLGEIGAPCV